MALRARVALEPLAQPAPELRVQVRRVELQSSLQHGRCALALGVLREHAANMPIVAVDNASDSVNIET